MGCDIHAYIEYWYKDDPKYVYAFSGELDLGRCYSLFERLAGVRGDPRRAVVHPRGIPATVSYEVEHTYYENSVYDSDHFYVQSRNLDSSLPPVDHIQVRTANPDWHSASYLTLPELKKATSFRNLRSPMIRATIKAMAELERCKKKGIETRLTFWFDS